MTSSIWSHSCFLTGDPAKVQHGKTNMSALPKVSALNPCPFCGVLARALPHETQEGCIAALNTEITQMRGLLATLKPAAVARTADDQDDAAPAAIRLALD